MESRQWILTWLLIIFHPLEAAKEDKGEHGETMCMCVEFTKAS